MTEKTFKVRLLDKAILNKLKDFESVGCPTPKVKWWANLLDSSEPTIKRHFDSLVEYGYIEVVDKFDYKTTGKPW
jgi:hypothetical protein